MLVAPAVVARLKLTAAKPADWRHHRPQPPHDHRSEAVKKWDRHRTSVGPDRKLAKCCRCQYGGRSRETSDFAVSIRILTNSATRLRARPIRAPKPVSCFTASPRPPLYVVTHSRAVGLSVLRSPARMWHCDPFCLRPKAALESSSVGCAHSARIFVGWDSVPTASGRRPNLLWLRPEAALGDWNGW